MARSLVALRSGVFLLTESVVNFTGSTKTIVAAPVSNVEDARRWITSPQYPMPTEVYTVEVSTLAMDAIIIIIP